MKYCVLLALLLALGCVHVHGAPVEQDGPEQGSCGDASALAAARLALTKINEDRQEGYIFDMHRLSNVHMTKQGETGVVFYLTLDVVETNCSVLNNKNSRNCEARPTHDTPVYGQCKAAIFISKVHRVVRLYKYDCVVRPVPAARLHETCPDCPSLIDVENAEVKKAVSQSLEKFNAESGLSKRFALFKVNRARTGMAMSMYYSVEYTIQETTCTKSTEAADKCPFMDCEFSHKGFCKASLFYSSEGEAGTTVECEIYEPEAAEREMKHHLLGGETDHNHNDTHSHNHNHTHTHDDGSTHAHPHDHGNDHGNDHDHDHDHAHAADAGHTHDHVHDHTKSHSHHDKTQKHADNSDHHHTHDHEAGSGHRHAHDHSHDHGHGHDHVHSHHAKAHNHSDDVPNQHHDYKHANSMHTHDHDHELALDHDHKHAHLHEYEHHHHHHNHDHETAPHDHPEGMVRVLPAMGQSVTPSEVPTGAPEVGVTLPLKEDPQIPGQMEPTIQAFPTAVSAQCEPAAPGDTLVQKLFTEDPMFKPAA